MALAQMIANTVSSLPGTRPRCAKSLMADVAVLTWGRLQIHASPPPAQEQLDAMRGAATLNESSTRKPTREGLTTTQICVIMDSMAWLRLTSVGAERRCQMDRITAAVGGDDIPARAIPQSAIATWPRAAAKTSTHAQAFSVSTTPIASGLALASNNEHSGAADTAAETVNSATAYPATFTPNWLDMYSNATELHRQNPRRPKIDATSVAASPLLRIIVVMGTRCTATCPAV